MLILPTVAPHGQIERMGDHVFISQAGVEPTVEPSPQSTPGRVPSCIDADKRWDSAAVVQEQEKRLRRSHSRVVEARFSLAAGWAFGCG